MEHLKALEISKETMANSALRDFRVLGEISKKGLNNILDGRRMSDHTRTKFDSMRPGPILEISKLFNVFYDDLKKEIQRYAYKIYNDFFSNVRFNDVNQDTGTIHLYVENKGHLFFDFKVVEDDRNVYVKFLEHASEFQR